MVSKHQLKRSRAQLWVNTSPIAHNWVPSETHRNKTSLTQNFELVLPTVAERMTGGANLQHFKLKSPHGSWRVTVEGRTGRHNCLSVSGSNIEKGNFARGESRHWWGLQKGEEGLFPENRTLSESTLDSAGKRKTKSCFNLKLSLSIMLGDTLGVLQPACRSNNIFQCGFRGLILISTRMWRSWKNIRIFVSFKQSEQICYIRWGTHYTKEYPSIFVITQCENHALSNNIGDVFLCVAFVNLFIRTKSQRYS